MASLPFLNSGIEWVLGTLGLAASAAVRAQRRSLSPSVHCMTEFCPAGSKQFAKQTSPSKSPPLHIGGPLAQQSLWVFFPLGIVCISLGCVSHGCA